MVMGTLVFHDSLAFVSLGSVGSPRPLALPPFATAIGFLTHDPNAQ